MTNKWLSFTFRYRIRSLSKANAQGLQTKPNLRDAAPVQRASAAGSANTSAVTVTETEKKTETTILLPRRPTWKWQKWASLRNIP